MFEAVVLFALLGVILLFIITSDRPGRARKASFIDLAPELKPSAKKSERNWS